MSSALRVPFFRQRFEYSCGPAVLQMVLRYWGVSSGQARLIRLCRTTPAYGTPRRYLLEAARFFNLHVWAHSNATVAEIEKFLRYRIPVIVNYRETHDEESHFAVVVQLTASAIILHDPYHGPRISLPRKEFLKRWHGKHITKNRHWILAAAPRGASLR